MASGNSDYILVMDNGITVRERNYDAATRSVENLLIGRDPQSNLPLSDSQVSWQHARVFYTDGSYYIVDLESTNGTLLNGNPLSPQQAARLRPGDVVRVGDCELRCEEKQSVTPAAPKEHSLIVGRDPEADIVLSQSDVSWRHARLTRQGEGWHIEDLGSSNGTFINGARIESGVARPGDEVQIGLTKLALDYQRKSRISKVAPIEIEARGLSRVVRSGGVTMTLLDDVSLRIHPHELVAIIGASGAGKTTLLQALSGYQPATHGQVTINGIDYYAHREQFRTAIGYVPQEDIVHRDLSVHSALGYAARLRLPPRTSDAEIESLVAKVLSELGISHRAHHLVRTLSGGERKRVNIGVELLTSPGALFLDEPTTGLDIALERRIMRLLRALADEGRAIVQVTHSITALEDYDKMVCMAAGGRLAFCGTPQAALEHFGVSSFVEIYDRLNEGSHPSYHKSTFHSLFFRAATPASAPLASPHYDPWKQFCVLTRRYLEIIQNDTYNLIFWLAQAPFIGLFILMLFDANVFSSNQTPGSDGQLPIKDAPLLLFLLAFSAVCFGLCSSVREIVKEKLIYNRERHLSLGIWPYVFSKVAVLGLVSLCQCIVLLLIVTMKIHLGLDAPGVMQFFFLLWLGAVCAVLLGLTLSALAASADQAITLVAAFLLAQALSGLISLEKLNVLVRWIPALCATRWSYGGLCAVTDMANRWSDLGLGSQVHDVMNTPAGEAWLALIVMAVVLVWAVGLVLSREHA